MRTTAIASIWVWLALSACAQQPNEAEPRDWVHPQQVPGNGCDALRAPSDLQVIRSNDPAAQRLLGRWSDGFWMGTDGSQSGDCLGVTMISINGSTAKLFLGFSGRDEPWITEATYQGGIISHKTRSGVAFWIKAEDRGNLQVKFLDNDPVATYFATLRRGD